MNSDEIDLDSLLKGKTLQIYWFLLTRGEAGVREVQRDLNINSPSSVSYHLTKLMNAGLVFQEVRTGKYRIRDEVQTGVLGLYVKIGRRMIPRMLFYLSFLICGFSLFWIAFFFERRSFQTVDLLFLVFLGSAIGFYIFETYKIWGMKPL
ncbi:MAG: transcriptional regulator [Candidatus Heimdallarchaeota archaeon]|nr:transcriptional regulator [Candidatus Heimdallarchaeota archaeon]